MTSSETALENLRRDIDRIDDSIHDLLMQRVEIVARVGGVKSDGAPLFRPAREARILRRLIRRHAGPFPKPVLTHIWREMLGATVRQQGAFAIGAHAPDGEQGCWDLARNHFGAHAPVSLHGSVGQIVSDVTAGRLTLGIVPYPRESEHQPWWPLLASADPSVPRVVARLPFAGRAQGRTENFDALILARQPHEYSGSDVTMILLETDATVSRATLRNALAETGLTPRFFASWVDAERLGSELTLAEVEGFASASDRRVASLAGVGIRRVVIVGGYAVPLSEAELAAG
jgi:chorismate mutase-like protein